MGSSDGEGLSQLYLKLVHAYNKRFMLQKGQAAVLKCSTIWKKMRRSFETLSDLILKFIPKLGNGKLWLTRPPIKVVH